MKYKVGDIVKGRSNINYMFDKGVILAISHTDIRYRSYYIEFDCTNRNKKGVKHYCFETDISLVKPRKRVIFI